MVKAVLTPSTRDEEGEEKRGRGGGVKKRNIQQPLSAASVTAGHVLVRSFISTCEQYSKITANEHMPGFNTIKH